ncbi:MAG: ribonuclease T2 family protein [Propylenella sp.]
MNRLPLYLAILLSLAWPGAASAQVPLKGYFIAFSDCEANKKKDSDNPGSVRLEVLRAYAMLGRNSTPGTHYQVRVPGAPETEARWVPMNCGAYAPQESLVLAGKPSPGGDGGGSGGGSGGSGGDDGGGLAPDSIEFVLAASWEPAFCASSAGRNKPECKSLTADRFDATHFALHGLWPDDLDDKAIFPCYCARGAPRSCSGSLSSDASIDLSQAVLYQLSVVMPGVQSGLHLHEWPKHGSCYEEDKSGEDKGATPDEYFAEVLALMEQLNASPAQALFAENIGEMLKRDAIEAAFDQAFGAGASDRLTIRCSGSGADRNIAELWINLKGDVRPESDLATLILAAPPTSTSTNTASCGGGRVVKVTGN